ncbi:hypothetical protein EVAR_81735_1 [Eumeta japonica]|uniref:Uncharacterized protein n=1 Tax=Eumeta variegata TaxID=151549 RepID=A0A4C1UIZ4_EUMVA|nr:hypothetical protein EVAR_81735_1 [Eumeta japonica]
MPKSLLRMIYEKKNSDSLRTSVTPLKIGTRSRTSGGELRQFPIRNRYPGAVRRDSLENKPFFFVSTSCLCEECCAEEICGAQSAPPLWDLTVLLCRPQERIHHGRSRLYSIMIVI